MFKRRDRDDPELEAFGPDTSSVATSDDDTWEETHEDGEQGPVGLLAEFQEVAERQENHEEGNDLEAEAVAPYVGLHPQLGDEHQVDVPPHAPEPVFIMVDGDDDDVAGDDAGPVPGVNETTSCEGILATRLKKTREDDSQPEPKKHYIRVA